MATDVYRRHQTVGVHHVGGQSVSPHSVRTSSRRWQLQDFNYRIKMLLTKADRQYLHAVLGEYQLYRQIDKLVLCLRAVLDTPAKLDLLRDIRYFIPSAHVSRYDALAPYHKMAHMWRPPGVTGSLTRPAKRNNIPGSVVSVPSTPQMKSKVAFGTQAASEMLSDSPADLKVVTLVKGHEDALGFSIRGGSEHGLGVFISEVEGGTAAEWCGLRPGDNILEVNSVSFESIASSSAVKVLTGSNRLKMVVRRLGKIPGFRSAKEKTTWFDVEETGVTDGAFENHGAFHHPPGLDSTDGVMERRINLTSSRDGQHLGFNIRGGSEYGLGVYVSRVDIGGLAGTKGLKVGDQLVEVNGLSFQTITHAHAVEYMRSHRQLMLTVRDIGMFPAYKEIYAEYRWIDAHTGSVTKTRSSAAIRSVPVRPPSPGSDEEISQETLRQFPRDSRVESYMEQTHYDSDSEDEVIQWPIGTRLPLDVSTEDSPILYPGGLELFEIPALKADGYVESEDYEEILRRDYGEVIYSEEAAETSFPAETPRVPKSQTEVLVPRSNDVLMRERPTEVSDLGSEVKGRHKDKSPKSTIAVRAMEMETRKKYPELALDFDSQRFNVPHRGKSKDDLDLDINSTKKSKSLREKFFGSKSKAKFKSAGHAGRSKSKNRLSLSNLTFSDNQSQDTGQLDSRSQQVNDSVIPVTWREVESKAHNVLNEDEVVAIVRHLSRYESEQELESLMTPLLAILDTLDKMTLIELIRPGVRDRDKSVFDEWVQHHTQRLRAREAVSPRGSANTIGSKPRLSSDSSYNSNSEAIDKYKRLKRPSADRSRFSSLDLMHQNVVEQMVVPGPPDAQHNLEIHRPRSSSKVYKAIVLPGSEASTHQAEALGQPDYQQESGLLLEAGSGEEEADNFENISKEALPRLNHAAPQQLEPEHVVPVYATVDRSKKMSSRVRAPHVKENGMSGSSNDSSQASSKDPPASMRSTLTPVDSELSATESERYIPVITSKSHANTHATLGLFDDLLNDSEDDTDDDAESVKSGVFTATFRPMSSPTPSDATSDTSAHWGSYEVNPEEDKGVTPVFFAPPPPVTPPPADVSSRGGETGDDIAGLADWLADDLDRPVLGVKPRSTVTVEQHKSSGTSGTIFRSVDVSDSMDARHMNYLTVSTMSTTSSIQASPRDDSKKLRMGDNQLNTITFANDTIQDMSFTTGRPDTVQDTASVVTWRDDEVEDSSSVATMEDSSFATRRADCVQHSSFTTIKDDAPEDLAVIKGNTVEDPGFATRRMDAVEDSGFTITVGGNDTINSSFATRRDDTMHDSSFATRSQSPQQTGYSEKMFTVSAPVRDPDVDLFFDNKAAHTELTPNGGIDESMAPSGEDRQYTIQVVPSSQDNGTVDHRATTGPPTEYNMHMDYRVTQVASTSDTRTMSTEYSTIPVLPSSEEEESDDEGPGILRVRLDKTIKSLGISISGGRDSRSQPDIRIQSIFPNGAAAAEGTLQAGMQLLSIDGQSLEGATHAESVETVRKSYGNKQQRYMDLIVLPVIRKTWDL